MKKRHIWRKRRIDCQDPQSLSFSPRWGISSQMLLMSKWWTRMNQVLNARQDEVHWRLERNIFQNELRSRKDKWIIVLRSGDPRRCLQREGGQEEWAHAGVCKVSERRRKNPYNFQISFWKTFLFFQTNWNLKCSTATTTETADATVGNAQSRRTFLSMGIGHPGTF